MLEEKFETNLLRFIAAELYFLTAMQTAQAMFGKSYFSLGVTEKVAVDQAALASVGANYQTLTQDYLKSSAGHQAGFQPPPAKS